MGIWREPAMAPDLCRAHYTHRNKTEKNDMKQTNDAEMTYEKFVELVDTMHSQQENSQESQRYGQTYFNTLAVVREDLSESIRGTRYDPYYSDTVPGQTEELLKSKWRT